MGRRTLAILMLILLLTALPATAMARELEYNRTGSISVTLTTQGDNLPLTGAELSVYRIADVGVNTSGNLNYIYTDTFKDCGIPLEDPQLTVKLEQYLQMRVLPVWKQTTDDLGTAVFSDLPLGLYFVQQTGVTEGYAPCRSFLVTVPSATADGYEYDVNASPKTEVIRLADITIQKVWNTGKSAVRPDSVTIQLLRGDTVVETAVLNEENQWKITYPDMPESDDYSVKEVKVPQGFTATYKQNGYEFTVTNTSSLAQTGQLVWPIPLLAMAGLFLLTVGAVALRRVEDDDA